MDRTYNFDPFDIKRTLILMILVFFLCFMVIESEPENARVAGLPGFNDSLPSPHYSGYVTIDEKNGKRLFYYFVTSENNSAVDPVVLWLNGGPGCSSFDGFVYEHGPFNFEPAKTKGGLPQLHKNPYSWSKVSNVIYLDSPAGVGYSYSNNKSDYTTGDQQTAIDVHAFLLKWFDIYKEYAGNPFFIAGESYAGIYVPTLASEIVKGLDAGLKPVINLKGYLVGNGVTDEIYDGNALVPFAHGMGLISNDLYQAIRTACEGNYYNSTSESCQLLIDKVDKVVDGVNIYDILEPCYHTPDSGVQNLKLPSSFKTLGGTERPLPVRKRIFGRAWPLRAPVRDGHVPTWPELANSDSVPCINDEVATRWLNDKTVRIAIHAEEESVSGRWELCTNRISYDHDTGSMIKYHKELTSRGYRVLIYSGDHDMCVPYTGSEAWTKSVGYKVMDEWRSWVCNEQVSGFTQGYEKNLTFLTVKGAGHTVPEYKPREALYFYSQFLAGKPI